MIRNYMYYECSHSMAGHFTTQKVLKLVLGEDEDDEQYNDIYFDGSDEDFGLVEEEVRDELILDKNEHGINDRAVMDIEMGENECDVNNNDDRDREDDDVYGDDNNDDIGDVRMEDESDYDDDERSENEESDDDSRENNERPQRKGKGRKDLQ